MFVFMHQQAIYGHGLLMIIMILKLLVVVVPSGELLL